MGGSGVNMEQRGGNRMKTGRRSGVETNGWDRQETRGGRTGCRLPLRVQLPLVIRTR